MTGSPTYVKNEIEKSFVFTDNDGLLTNISKLVAAGNDPECICIAKYKDGQEDPVVEVKLYKDEQRLLQDLINLP